MFAVALSSFQQEPWEVLWFQWGPASHSWLPMGACWREAVCSGQTSTFIHLLVLLRSATTVCTKKQHFHLQTVSVLGIGSRHTEYEPLMLIHLPKLKGMLHSSHIFYKVPVFSGIPHLQYCLYVKYIFTLPIFKQRSMEANLLLCSIDRVLIIS